MHFKLLKRDLFLNLIVSNCLTILRNWDHNILGCYVNCVAKNFAKLFGSSKIGSIWTPNFWVLILDKILCGRSSLAEALWQKLNQSKTSSQNLASHKTHTANSIKLNWKKRLFFGCFCPMHSVTIRDLRIANRNLRFETYDHHNNSGVMCQLAYGKFFNISILSRLPHWEVSYCHSKQNVKFLFGLRNVNFLVRSSYQATAKRFLFYTRFSVNFKLRLFLQVGTSNEHPSLFWFKIPAVDFWNRATFVLVLERNNQNKGSHKVPFNSAGSSR